MPTTIKVRCVECRRVEVIPLKDYGPLGPACSKCMGAVTVEGADVRPVNRKVRA